jgi:hypothetical protein
MVLVDAKHLTTYIPMLIPVQGFMYLDAASASTSCNASTARLLLHDIGNKTDYYFCIFHRDAKLYT